MTAGRHCSANHWLMNTDRRPKTYKFFVLSKLQHLSASTAIAGGDNSSGIRNRLEERARSPSSGRAPTAENSPEKARLSDAGSNHTNNGGEIVKETSARPAPSSMCAA